MHLHRFLLVVIQIIDCRYVLTLKAENNSPVAAYLDRPKTGKIAGQFVQPQAWRRQVSGLGRIINGPENQADAPGMMGLNAAFPPGPKKKLEPLVAK